MKRALHAKAQAVSISKVVFKLSSSAGVEAKQKSGSKFFECFDEKGKVLNCSEQDQA